jgi:hypothetical protein
MPNSSDRSRRCRQRKRAGRGILEIEVDDLAELADMLVVGRFLEQWDSEKKTEIARATKKFLAFMIVHRGNF